MWPCTYHPHMVWFHWNRPQTLYPASLRQTPSLTSWCLWLKLENRAGKFHKSDPVFAPSWNGHCKHPDSRTDTVSPPPGRKCGRRAWPRFPREPGNQSVHESDTDGLRDEGSAFSTCCGVRVTHGDPPGAFAVGFVEAREPLTTNKPRVWDQVASTVEHWPVMKETVRQEVISEMDRTEDSVDSASVRQQNCINKGQRRLSQLPRIQIFWRLYNCLWDLFEK